MKFSWTNRQHWIVSSKNTLWCLCGCSIGDIGTVAFFQFTHVGWTDLSIMSLAIINGIITSIILETIILLRQMSPIIAFKTATSMSLISMITMELVMNVTDIFLIGEARLTWWIIPLMLTTGFLVPLQYNYWKLEKFGKSCH